MACSATCILPPSSSCLLIPSAFESILRPSLPLQTSLYLRTKGPPLLIPTILSVRRLPIQRATVDEKDQSATIPLLIEKEQPHKEVDESVMVLKNAAKTRKVQAEEVLAALSVLEKAKLDPSGFLDTLGGSKSPGRTWMLVFAAEKRLERGNYFPLTAVQRFDAAGKRIENGVYLGTIGQLTFEGRFSWNKRILAFVFERIRIKVGPFNPFEIKIKGNDESEPSNKNPFFTWFYVDEELAVARGKSGGTAFWVRCRRESAC